MTEIEIYQSPLSFFQKNHYTFYILRYTMKKIIVMCSLWLCITFVVSAQVFRGGTLYAAAKSVALKSSTGFFARTNGTLSYGDQVTVLQVNGKWVEVRSIPAPSLSGWTASSNLSAKRVVAVGNTNSASASEIGLAGKGFNQEVENSYKSKTTYNFADVDRTEALTVTESDLQSFLVEGRLSMGEK
jgi:hypothetical protein